MKRVETEEITKVWVPVPPEVVSRREGRGRLGAMGLLDLHVLFLGGSNAEKWGDHLKRKNSL